MTYIRKRKNVNEEKKSCHLIKVNKKNTLLKENNNKISDVSEAIIKKKKIEKKKSYTYWLKFPYRVEFSRMG